MLFGHFTMNRPEGIDAHNWNSIRVCFFDDMQTGVNHEHNSPSMSAGRFGCHRPCLSVSAHTDGGMALRMDLAATAN